MAKVVREGYPDHFAFDKKNPYFDAKSDPENTRWLMVEVEFVEAFPEVVPLNELKAKPELGEMALIKRARLSVQPVTKEEFQVIRKMGRKRTALPTATPSTERARR